MLRRLAVLGALALAVPATATAVPFGNANVAALQVGLRARGLYSGTIDGQIGPATVAAVRSLGGRTIFDGRTRSALGSYGRHRLGSRTITDGTAGWDAAAMQFMLAWHGFPSATIDGAFGNHSVRALKKFEAWAHLPVDGVAGPAVLAALRKPAPTCPIPLRAPLQTTYTDVFGPRGDRFHTGVDYPAATGTPVAAAAPGRVTWAGDPGGGWGMLVTVAHTHGVRTMYAHLSQALVRVGQHVSTGQTIGAVGATGHASGPHVHFEVRLRGAAVDPFTGLNRSS
jgi:peptidoglycan hydrolase-like protein with peptidoglycan-binding domain